MHMMIDTETWGLAANSAIRSVGLVFFDPYAEPGKVGTRYYCATIDETGTKDEKTEKWWSEQSEEARSVFVNPVDIGVVLSDIHILYRGTCEKVWAHGSVFDIPLLENAFARHGLEAPWNYKDVRDTRTIYELAGETIVSLPGYETKHHALHDAYNQAVAVQRSYRKLFAK